MEERVEAKHKRAYMGKAHESDSTNFWKSKQMLFFDWPDFFSEIETYFQTRYKKCIVKLSIVLILKALNVMNVD